MKFFSEHDREALTAAEEREQRTPLPVRMVASEEYLPITQSGVASSRACSLRPRSRPDSLSATSGPRSHPMLTVCSAHRRFWDTLTRR